MHKLAVCCTACDVPCTMFSSIVMPTAVPCKLLMIVLRYIPTLWEMWISLSQHLLHMQAHLFLVEIVAAAAALGLGTHTFLPEFYTDSLVSTRAVDWSPASTHVQTSKLKCMIYITCILSWSCPATCFAKMALLLYYAGAALHAADFVPQHSDIWFVT